MIIRKLLIGGVSMSEEIGCSDGYCLIKGKAKGMHTNGGCKCVSDRMRRGGFQDRIDLERVLQGLHKKIEFLQPKWISVDEFDYNVSHISIIAWARKMPMSMGSYEDGYFTLYDTEDCGIFEGDAEWFKDNFEAYMPSPLQPARSST